MPEKCKFIYGTSRGIKENIEKPASLFKKNLVSLNKLLDCAEWNGYRRVCIIGSSCAYPCNAEQPFKETTLGTGCVEPTSAPYAYTKLAAWQLCRAISEEYGYQYFMAIPSDIYGDPEDNHFIGDLIRKFHKAKEEGDRCVTVWGSGTPVRQPLYDEDFTRLLEHIDKYYFDVLPINLAPTETTSIGMAARLISDVVGYHGDIVFDCKKPDGQMKKVLDNSRLLKMEPSPFTSLKEGLQKAYERFLQCKKK